MTRKMYALFFVTSQRPSIEFGIKDFFTNWNVLALLVIFLNGYSYLDNTQQRVVICGSSSQWGVIPAGVPQGSHLGPLLFIIYINDITEKIRSNIKLFADDTSLYVLLAILCYLS